MTDTKKKLLRSTPVLVIGAIWEFLNHWSLLDAVLSKLKAQGAAGLFIANVITSLSLRLILIGLGFVLVAKAYFFPVENTKSIPADKISVSSVVTPKYIVGFFADHTHIQAESLIKPLRGQMIEVSGSIQEISRGWSYILVQIRDSDGIWLALTFPPTRADKLSILKKGHKIVAVGKIDKVNGGTVFLEDCELKSAYV